MNECKCGCGALVKNNWHLGHNRRIALWNRNNQTDQNGPIKFGRLTPIEEIRKNRRIYVHCECDCGNKVDVAKQHLYSGTTRSCGCLVKQIVGDMFRTHGKSHTKTYKSWSCMIQRCTNNKYTEYYLYGGRGIKIHEPWLSFEAFYADMGEAPKGTSIDRINGEGDYTPYNCRWATPAEQARNGRNVKLTMVKASRIREFLWAGIPVKELSSLFSVSTDTIRNIKNNKSWT